MRIPEVTRPVTSIGRIFSEHPETVGETYLEHLETASFFGSRMIVAGMACMLHGPTPSSTLLGQMRWCQVCSEWSQPNRGGVLHMQNGVLLS